MAFRVLVVGGKGFIGSKTVAALRALPGVEADVGTRRPDPGETDQVSIDLNVAASYSAMDAYDAVVNCSDTLRAPPDHAIAHVLERGLTFIESAADQTTIDRVLRGTRGPAALPLGADGGRVILGMGLFPGLSNLLAREVVATGGARRLDLVVRLDPMSGAGAALCELMVHLTRTEAIRYEDGVRMVEPAIGWGMELPARRGTRPTLSVGLPESVMFRISPGVASTGTQVGTVPWLPRWLLAPAVRWMPRGPGSEKVFVPLLRGYVKMLRMGLFANRPTRVELTVLADRERFLSLATRDGMRVVALALAAAVETLEEGLSPPPGTHLPDEVFSLADIVRRVNRRASGGRAELSLRGNLTPRAPTGSS